MRERSRPGTMTIARDPWPQTAYKGGMQPRRVHYDFSHRLLPTEAHADPMRMLAELRTPLRDGFLLFLWESLGKELGEPDAQGAVGLTVAGVDEQDGATYALIAMPAPIADGESHFVAVVHGAGRTHVFVLDRTSDGEGSLAKLGPDASRLSYGRIAATQDAFLAKVVELVRTEPDAGAPSAGGSIGGAWGPSSAPASAPSGSIWGPPGGAPKSAPGSAPSGGAPAVGGVWGPSSSAPPSSGASVGNVWGPSASGSSTPAGGGASVGSVWGPSTSGSSPSNAPPSNVGAVWGPSTGGGAFGGPGSAGPKPVGAVWGPGGKPAPKKGGGGCTVPIVGCLGLIAVGVVLLGVFTYEGADSFEDHPFQLSATMVMSPEGEESVSLVRTGGPGFAYYELTGPGDTTSCQFGYYADNACVIPVSALDERTLRYEVEGTGSPARLFGFALGGIPRSTQTVTVQRTTSLTWSTSRNATVCMGARCRVELQLDGSLHLRDAPAGTMLHLGTASGAESVPVDVLAEADRVGVARLLAAPAGERASIPGVRVVLADGTSIEGSVEVPMTTLATLLSRRFADVERSSLGPATGTAALWVVDDVVRSVQGSPARVADVGRLVITTTGEVPAGQCGPYALWGVGAGSRIPRVRTEATVMVYDRQTERVVTRRTFRGATPSCPYSISTDEAMIRLRDTADADAFAQAQLQGT